jgi:hypothetical protein
VADSDEPKGSAEDGADGQSKTKTRRRRRGGRGRKPAGEAQTALPEMGTPEEAVVAERMANEALAEAAAEEQRAERAEPAPHDDRPPVDLEAFARPGPKRYGPAKLEDDEAALAAAYADEMGGVATAPVEGEHVDEKTADEDRPMTEAYQPDSGRDRRGRHKNRRDRDKGRGKDRDKGKEKDKAAKPAAPAQPVAPPAERGRDRDRNRDRGERDRDRADRDRDRADRDRADRDRDRDRADRDRADRDRDRADRDRDRDRDRVVPAGRPAPRVALQTTPILTASYQVLVGLNDPRPVHARQLAAMAVKRKLLSGDPEDLWRPMRLALIAAARAESGLRPRVRFHGGSLFTLAATRLDEELARIEQSAADRLAELEAATVVALGQRLRGLAATGLEAACRLYLDRMGWRDLARVKRNEETDTWYLSGISPDGVNALVAVRAGSAPAGRHSVGELRAGVEAKGVGAGWLLAPAPLDEDGQKLILEPGPPVHALVGDALSRAFADVAVGVHRSWAPVSYLDVDFFGDLVES